MYVKEIWRYPVKSMAGEQLQAARLTLSGIAGEIRLNQEVEIAGTGTAARDRQ
jgi:uncharacterized protein YcbX